jgi:hypothetical protein
MSTDVNAILVAYEGRKEMLRDIFGGGPSSQKAFSPLSDPNAPVLPAAGEDGRILIPANQITAEQFDALF